MMQCLRTLNSVGFIGLFFVVTAWSCGSSTPDPVPDTMAIDGGQVLDTGVIPPSDTTSPTDTQPTEDTNEPVDTSVVPDTALPMDTQPESDTNMPSDTSVATDTKPGPDTWAPVDVTEDAGLDGEGPDTLVIEDVAADTLAPMDVLAEDVPDVIPEGKACLTPDPCFDEWFCKADGCGDALQGVCSVMVTDCSDAPITGICGCDGNSYLSPCHAAAAGVNVAAYEACPSKVLNCNVTGESGCAEGQHCLGGCEGLGFCQDIPDSCAGEPFKQVCACNGKTYSSACMAKKLGQNIVHPGPCPGANDPPEPCGGPEGLTCEAPEHCDMHSCAEDAAGLCQSIFNPADGTPGLLCLPSDPPECGCDGKTYTNKCQRILADMGKEYDGPCTDDGPLTCKVEDGKDACPNGMHCKGPMGQCNGEGVCEKSDFLCCLLGIEPPVCGCDGKTYKCACAALKAGVPIFKGGECGS